jgi:hypothetical protein
MQLRLKKIIKNISMYTVELKNLAINIVRQACELKNKHTSEINSSVNYACIFAHSEVEFKILENTALQFGSIVKITPTGPIFHIESLNTVSGKLKLLKIDFPTKISKGWVMLILQLATTRNLKTNILHKIISN